MQQSEKRRSCRNGGWSGEAAMKLAGWPMRRAHNTPLRTGVSAGLVSMPTAATMLSPVPEECAPRWGMMAPRGMMALRGMLCRGMCAHAHRACTCPSAEGGQPHLPHLPHPSYLPHGGHGALRPHAQRVAHGHLVAAHLRQRRAHVRGDPRLHSALVGAAHGARHVPGHAVSTTATP